LIAIIEIRALPPGSIHMQLTKLNTASAAQSSACHQRNLNESSNSARVNSQNTTTLPVESAISGAWKIETGADAPMPEVTAWAAEPSAKATARRPATTFRKSRNSVAASTSSRATVPARRARSITAGDIGSTRTS
jgi:hypothetical protein